MACSNHFCSIVEPVGQERNAAQLEGRRMVLGILGGYLRVEFAGFGKFSGLEQPVGRFKV